MSAVQKLQAVKEGDVIDGPKLFGRMSDEPIKISIGKISETGTVNMETSFMGIPLVSLAGKPVDDKVVWSLI